MTSIQGSIFSDPLFCSPKSRTANALRLACLRCHEIKNSASTAPAVDACGGKHTGDKGEVDLSFLIIEESSSRTFSSYPCNTSEAIIVRPLTNTSRIVVRECT